MQISRILFQKTLLAKTCLKQARQLPRTSLCAVNTDMRYFSTSSKTESAAKSDRFNQKEAEKAEEKLNEEVKEEQQEPTEEQQEVDPKVAKLEKQISELETMLETKESHIEDTNKKLEKIFNKYRYQIAENDNTVKRYKEEVTKAKSFAITKFAKDLINVRDDFQRAIDHSSKFDHESCEDLEDLKNQYKNLLSGIDMTKNVFDKTMKRFDVEEYNPVGEKFDPNFHEAMAMVDDPTKDPNTICEVMTTGWKIGDRVLRASQVFCVKKR
ncbi:unnamed protein product [Moneuplotes crassus]|uniref:GrpE protein homolog n=1 Tax=Euplotes crassus TaxID=5936 RepID=A0AAD1XS07_EUPCR|nr:unnamed protein product [Moneuplotes crassus]